MKAQEIIDECEYNYFKIVCDECDKILVVTNHKKKLGDIMFVGDGIPTKYYRGTLKNGEIIGCICGSIITSSDIITDKEYKKIRKTLI